MGAREMFSKEKTLFFEDLNGLLLSCTTFPTTFVWDCGYSSLVEKTYWPANQREEIQRDKCFWTYYSQTPLTL